MDQVAIDKSTADRENLVVGDQIQVITDTGTYPFTITALVGLGDSDGFAGAIARRVGRRRPRSRCSARRTSTTRSTSRSTTASTRRTVIPRIEQVLPANTEVVTRDVLIKENKAGARHDHQRLRQRPARLRLRHRVRQRLPHQQRVPDHDRPTAAGAGPDAGRRRQGLPGHPPDPTPRRSSWRSSRRSLGIAGGVVRGQGADLDLQLGRRRVPEHGHRAAPAGPSSSPSSSASASRWRR